MTISLLVSDMAGTTVQDDGIVESSFTEALASMGVGPADEAYGPALDLVRETMGMSKVAVFQMILHDEVAAVRAVAAFEASIARRIEAGEIGPIPGAVQALREIRAAGIKIVLTTGFSHETRELLVEQLGWHDLVDLSLSPTKTLRGRPYPDMALHALIELEIESVREIATVGDTASDLSAGWNAGASVVAAVLTGAHDRATLEAAPHTHILASITELPAVLSAS
jgi:phosphonatase-like hydrolase